MPPKTCMMCQESDVGAVVDNGAEPLYVCLVCSWKVLQNGGREFPIETHPDGTTGPVDDGAIAISNEDGWLKSSAWVKVPKKAERTDS